jgi:GNAT-family acetyltransferase (TIGR03103 family)
MGSDVVLDLAWGRLVFGQTFASLDGIVKALRSEESGRRDICIYARDPHVLVGMVPDELFIDPSYTYRLDLHRYRPRAELIRGVFVRTVTALDEMRQINGIYARNGMVTGDADTMWANHRTRCFTYLVAEDRRTGRVVGTVTGVDHVLAFGDPEGGASLWCLAVDAQDAPPGTGEALVRVLAERYVGRGRAYLDLSVIHDNTAAIALYRKLGFHRVPALCVKRKNPINTPLFAARPPGLEDLNPYARIIAEEALERGVRVEVSDAEWGEMRLSLGGRTVLTRESLSEFTSAVAMSRCDDKRVTRRIMERAGVRVPRGATVTDGDLDAARTLLAESGEVVVKPARGEQGKGITVGVDLDRRARAGGGAARPSAPTCWPRSSCPARTCASSSSTTRCRPPRSAGRRGRRRRPPHGQRAGPRHQPPRERATGGSQRIPRDDSTRDVVRAAGYAMDDVLPTGQRLRCGGRPTCTPAAPSTTSPGAAPGDRRRGGAASRPRASRSPA